MDNGELYRLLTEQLNNRLDRMENTLQHYLDNQSIVCKDHDKRIDDHENKLSVIADRQEQANDREKKRLSIIAVFITIANSILSFFMSRYK